MNQFMQRNKEESAAEALLQNLSPESRARLVSRLQQGNRLKAAAQVIVPRHGAEPLSLSFPQERLWFLDQLNPGNCSHLVCIRLRIRGPLQRELLEKCLNEIVSRHEVLRTSFETVDGIPRQKVFSRVQVPFQALDLQMLPAEKAEEHIQCRAHEEARTPFDLSQAPLLRAALLRLNSNEHVLLLTLHHIVSDAWSIAVLIQEFVELYAAFSAGNLNPLKPLPIQYADYALWQRNRMQGETLARLLSYWKKNLAGMPEHLPLPTSFSRPQEQSNRGRTVYLTIPSELTGALKQLARKQDVTLFMLALSAFKALLCLCARQTDIVVGTHIANRTRDELKGLIGFFLNHLVLRTDLSGNPSFKELVARVREVALSAYEHQDLPLELLAAELQSKRTLQRSSLFQVMFVLQNAPEARLKIPDFEIEPLSFASETANMDLYLSLTESQGELRGALEYRTDLFDEPTAIAILGSFKNILEQITNNPDCRLAELELTPGLIKETTPETVSEKEPNRLVLAASFTADLTGEVLQFWSDRLSMHLAVSCSPYNQILQELLDPASDLNRPEPGINVILFRFEDWQRQQSLDPALVQRHSEDLVDAVFSARKRTNRPFLIGIAPRRPQLKHEPALAEAESRLEEQLGCTAGISFIREADWFKRYPCDDYYDSHGDEIAHIPYTEKCFAAMGTVLARHVRSLLFATPKIIASDCDNTLWRGVCGEDGPGNLAIEENHRRLHIFLNQQREKGILLCLCSKNEPADVEQVFQSRADLRIARSHFTSARINWEKKSANLRSLAQELTVGSDSLVLLDDNPVECAEVRANAPEIQVIQLPNDSRDWGQFLEHLWIFDHPRVTNEDRNRAAIYHDRVRREEFRAGTKSFIEFIAGLELKVDIHPLKDEELERVAQLAQRTQQFNSALVRHTVQDLAILSRKPGFFCHVVAAEDRFGKYGLIGTMISEVRPDGLLVASFLLSCRALGRGIEHSMVRFLGGLGREQGLDQMRFRYRRHERNRPARLFFEAISGDNVAATAGEWTFSIPTETAVNCTLTLDESTPEITDSATNSSVPAVTVRNDSQVWELIANELDTADKIAVAVRRHHFKKMSAKRAEYVAPRTPIEEMLAEIWQNLLGVEAVGIHDNFFELGGHSLLGTVMISRIRKSFNVNLPLKSIYENSTLIYIAECIEEQLLTLFQDARAKGEMKELDDLSEQELDCLIAREKSGEAGAI
jgi:FkbH-like protein